MAHGDAQSPSSAPPLPKDIVSAEQSPAMVPSSYPFGLRNAATSYAYAYTAAHKAPPERCQRFTLDLGTHADSSEEDEAWPRVDFSGLHDPGAMRRFLAASDYCFGYSDSDNEGTYDPARKCFHSGSGWRGQARKTRGRVAIPRFAQVQAPPYLRAFSYRQHGTRTLLLRDLNVQTWSSSVSSRPRSNRTDSFYSSFETLSNRSSEVVAKAEEPDKGPTMYIIASTTTTKGASNPQSSIALARMSRPRQCWSARCPSLLPRRGSGSMASSESS